MLSNEAWLNLFQSSNTYREFLSHAIEKMGKLDPNFSLTILAKKSGLKSKSLITDIKSGRRRITPKNFYLLQKGLQLPLEMESAFKLLVAKEELDLEPHLDAITIKKEFQRTLASLKNKMSLATKKEQIYQSTLWPIVFSALGDERGASVDEIEQRTKLSKLEIRQVLAQFKFHNLVKEVDDRFYVLLEGIENYQSDHNARFKEYFIYSMEKAVVQAKKNFSNQNNLFANSSFSIKQAQVPVVRQKLNKFLNDLLMSDVDDNGDRIATVNISLCLEGE